MSSPTARLRQGQWYATITREQLSIVIPAESLGGALRFIRQDPTFGVEPGAAATLNNPALIVAANARKVHV